MRNMNPIIRTIRNQHRGNNHKDSHRKDSKRLSQDSSKNSSNRNSSNSLLRITDSNEEATVSKRETSKRSIVRTESRSKSTIPLNS